MTHNDFDVQGHLLGIPYDFRVPTLERLKRRVFNPDAPMITPHVWGWGFSLNLAHKGSWLLIALVLLILLMG